MIDYNDPPGRVKNLGENPEQVPPLELQRWQQDHPNNFYLRDAIEELDTLAGDLLIVSQRAARAAAKRGDEIDVILAGIREISQGIKTRPK
jgi:uroporphyrinogen-III synthase